MSYYDANRTRPYPVLDSNTTSLDVRQQPLQALVTSEHKEKTRKAVDPPPIVQLKVRDTLSADQGTWLVNPFLFMNVHLVEPEPVNGTYNPVPGSYLLGSTVSSLHRLKDVNNKDGGFFVFGDISCRRVGVYRLQFNLFDLEKNGNRGHAVYITSQVSDPFQVVTSKDFRGQMESTHLSRTFSEQGVRLRLRKEQRTITGSKRVFRSSPNPSSSTTPIPYSISGDQLHDRAYAHSAPKRQRSDSDYTPQMYHTPQLGSNTIFPYGSHALSGHPQQSLPTCQGESYGSLLSQTHTQSTTIPHWQRHVQQEPLSAPVGGLGNYSYFGSLNTAAPGQREQTMTSQVQHQAQPYLSRATETTNPALSGFQIPSSFPDTAMASHQHHVYSHPSDLHSLAGNINVGPSTYQIQHEQDPSSHSQFGFRTPLSNPSVPSYGTRPQPGTSGATQDQRLQSAAAGQYEQGHFASGPELFPEAPRETFSSSTANLPDPNLSLDSGVLNRGFIPPYTGQPQDPTGQHTPDFKEPPYPTPH